MADEEVVKAFTKALYSMKEQKSAGSKTKIVDITKAAMNCLRYYKHVVHGVEKFLPKCNPKLKVPVLYVVDSIVRQGQKKFKSKDVFGPRFAKNLHETIQNALLTCPPEDKAQEIFPADLLKTLVDLCQRHGLGTLNCGILMCFVEVDAERVESVVKGSHANLTIYKKAAAKKKGTPRTPPPQSHSDHDAAKTNGSGEGNSHHTIPEAQFCEMLERMYPALSQSLSHDKSALKKAYKSFQARLRDAVDKEMSSRADNISNVLAKDFEYSDDEDDDRKTKAPEPLSKERVEGLAKNVCTQSDFLTEVQNTIEPPTDSRRGTSWRTDSMSSRKPASPPRGSSRDRGSRSNGRRKRSRSRSPRNDRKKRHRDRSGERRERSNRSPGPESAADRDREKDRKKNGLPVRPKPDHLVLATRTIWFGRLPPNCTEDNIKDALKETGYDSERINIIPSRACAYVTMMSRRAAFKILDKYKRDLRVQNKPIKVDWATGQGLPRGDKLMEYWDSDNGYAQIPHSKVPHDISKLIMGNYVDTDTLPPNLKGKYNTTGIVLDFDNGKSTDLTSQSSGISPPTPQPPLPTQAPFMGVPIPPGVPPPLPTNTSIPPPVMNPQLTNPGLPAGFPQLGIAPNFLQPNLLAAFITQQQQQQQQAFDQMMTNLQQNNQQPGLLQQQPPPNRQSLDHQLPPPQDNRGGPSRPYRGGATGGNRTFMNNGRNDGAAFFHSRGRGAFRGTHAAGPPFPPPRGPPTSLLGEPNANNQPLGPPNPLLLANLTGLPLDLNALAAAAAAGAVPPPMHSNNEPMSPAAEPSSPISFDQLQKMAEDHGALAGIPPPVTHMDQLNSSTLSESPMETGTTPPPGEAASAP